MGHRSQSGNAVGPVFSDVDIKPCHRVTAGLMIIDRVIGPVPDYDQPLDHWHDPSLEPNWIYRHPADLDSDVPIEKLVEADRADRKLFKGCLEELDSPCEDDYLCEVHDPDGGLHDLADMDEDQLLMSARSHRSLYIFHDRLYFDENGILRLHPPPSTTPKPRPEPRRRALS